jgi:ComF family protein
MPLSWNQLTETAANLGSRIARAGGFGRASDLLFSSRCAHCEADVSDDDMLMGFCDPCYQELLDGSDQPTCLRCGSRVPPTFDSSNGCLQCRRRPPRCRGVILLGPYRGALRSAVLKMKQPRHEPLAVAVAQLMCLVRANQLQKLAVDVVAPVPMHWRRRLARGVNSPDIVAETLSQALGRPFAPRLLRRRRNTIDQGDLSRTARIANVRGAFALSAGCDVRGSRVLLVDDVLTTAATSNECARAVRKAGATEVLLAVIARAESGPSA